MIRSIIKVGLFLIVGILVYNFFFGSAEEKAQSKEIINKATDVGKAGVGLLRDEVAKFRSGKYDNALDKIGTAIDATKEKVQEGSQLLDQITDWNEKKNDWQQKRDNLMDELEDAADETKEETKAAIKDMNKEAEDLAREGRKLERKLKKEQEKGN